MKKIWEILQKVVRFHFFPNQDKTNPLSIGEISGLFKNYFVFFYICGPSCNKMPLFHWWLWEARDEVITGKKLTVVNFMAKMLDKVPSRLKEALAFPMNPPPPTTFFSFNKVTFYFELIFPKKPWDWESCHEAVRKVKK